MTERFAYRDARGLRKSITRNNIPEGWVLVPREATPEMLRAAQPAFVKVNDIIILNAARIGGRGVEDPLPAAWRAMIAAAGEPPR